jgi:hypothetical protein
MFAMLDELTTSLQQYGQLPRMMLPLLHTLTILNQILTAMAGSCARQILALLGSGFQQNADHLDLQPSQLQSLG